MGFQWYPDLLNGSVSSQADAVCCKWMLDTTTRLHICEIGGFVTATLKPVGDILILPTQFMYMLHRLMSAILRERERESWSSHRRESPSYCQNNASSPQWPLLPSSSSPDSHSNSEPIILWPAVSSVNTHSFSWFSSFVHLLQCFGDISVVIHSLISPVWRES